MEIYYVRVEKFEFIYFSCQQNIQNFHFMEFSFIHTFKSKIHEKLVFDLNGKKSLISKMVWNSKKGFATNDDNTKSFEIIKKSLWKFFKFIVLFHYISFYSTLYFNMISSFFFNCSYSSQNKLPFLYFTRKKSFFPILSSQHVIIITIIMIIIAIDTFYLLAAPINTERTNFLFSSKRMYVLR